MARKIALVVSVLLIFSVAVPVAASASERPAAADTSWIKQTSGVNDNLTSVSAVTDKTAWAVGGSGKILKTTNGTSWVGQGTLPDNIDLSSVFAVNKDVAWTIGGLGEAYLTTNGSTWNKTPTDPTDPLGHTENLMDVWASSAQGAWIVGYDGTIVKTANGGNSWQLQSSGTDEHLWSIYALNNNVAWAVGNKGTIIKTTNGGGNWRQQQSGTDQMLRGVYALDAQTAWAVGYSGTILLTRDGGATWRRQACPVDDILFSVNAVDDMTAWAVGYNDSTDVGFAVKTVDGGRNWFMQPMNAAELHCISVIDANTAWAVGDSGNIWKTTGGGDTLYTWYFAEGYTGDGFQEYLCIGNAGASDAEATVSYIFQGGDSTDKQVAVPGNSRITVNVNSVIGPDREVSIKVSSYSNNLVAERPMYFDYTGGVAGRNWTGGTDAVGTRSPSYTWFFAEGNTLPEFDQYITVFNPMDSTKQLKFRYQIEGEGEKVVEDDIGGSSRTTFTTRDQVGSGKNVSLLLESSGPVVAERPMYFDYMGLATRGWTGGHCVLGTPFPGTDWFLAEGTTRDNAVDGAFEEWLTIQNPTPKSATVIADYLLGPGQGGPVQKTYTVPANERLTVSVNAEVGPNKDVSVALTSDTDFIVERPMYFNYHGKYPGGHDVMGRARASEQWFFAEGYTGPGFEQWLCVQNATTGDASLEITYYPEGGASPITTNHAVAAGTRYTIDVNSDAGSNLMISAKIVSDVDVIIERPMYFLYNGTWPGGTDVVGFSPTD